MPGTAQSGKGIFMNKAITDGVLLMPSPFASGLDLWSSGNGTPGSDTYDVAGNAAFVAADQDFGGCLELQKVNGTEKVRYTGETPLLPGCYLQIRVRIKAVSGNLPNVRIAGWAGGPGGARVTGLTETGPTVSLTTYGEVVEVAAIVGPGQRGGVDMPWGTGALYGHFGLDLTGPSGGVVRIDDVMIEDVTSFFLRDMLSLVDVRDYGAVGDGVFDNADAFEAADAAAAGRRVLVPAGSYHLGDTVTFNSPVVFEGTVSMPVAKMLVLTRNFDLPSYAAAFGDEETGFKKAFQALLNNSDHESLDLCGRKVTITAPVDMAAAVPNKSSFSTRRVIRNGQIEADGGPAWDTEVVSSQATYSPGNAKKLTNVANIANVKVGARVVGNGVGREIYVTGRNVGAGELTLSDELYGPNGTQSYSFRSYKYLLDFSGFDQLSKFGLSEIEFQCNGHCSAIRLPANGSTFAISDCFISRPKDRGITSIGTGCQGMLIDRCQFLSDEESLDVSDRTSIAINANANDVKIRNCRATRFLHFAVIGGQNSLIEGNHFFQGDEVTNGIRSAGIVLARTFTSTTILGNYVDNAFIEWTNERDASPAFTSGFSFSSLTVSDNLFLSGDVASFFSYIVVKPYGAGHFLNGVTISNNKFRSINGSIERADRVDDSFAGLDFDRTKNLNFHGNTYHNVSIQPSNPRRLRHSEATAAKTWVVDAGGLLPFSGWTLGVDSVLPIGPIKSSGGQDRFAAPFVRVKQGGSNDKIDVVWEEAVTGEVALIVRMDD